MLGALIHATGVVLLSVSIAQEDPPTQLPSAAVAALGLVTVYAVRSHSPALPRTHLTAAVPQGIAAYATDLYRLVWALRGWGLVVFVDWYVIGGSWTDPQATGFPLPNYPAAGLSWADGGTFGGLIVVGAAVLVWVWLGRREHRLGKWRAVLLPYELILASIPVLAMLMPRTWTTG